GNNRRVLHGDVPRHRSAHHTKSNKANTVHVVSLNRSQRNPPASRHTSHESVYATPYLSENSPLYGFNILRLGVFTNLSPRIFSPRSIRLAPILRYPHSYRPSHPGGPVRRVRCNRGNTSFRDRKDSLHRNG